MQTYLQSDFSEFLDDVLLPLEISEFLVQLYPAELQFSKKQNKRTAAIKSAPMSGMYLFKVATSRE